MWKKIINLIVAGWCCATLSATPFCVSDGEMCYNFLSDTTVELIYSTVCPDVVLTEKVGYKIGAMTDSAYCRLVSIGAEAFIDDGCLNSVSIPASVNHIGESAFAWLNKLTAVHFTSTCPKLTIDAAAFAGCNMQAVYLPVGTTTLQDNALAQCHSMKKLFIPSTVTSIGNRAFAYCDALTDVYVTWDSVALVKIQQGTEIFINGIALSSIRLHLPEAAKPKYAKTEPWKNFNLMGETTCTVIFKNDDGTVLSNKQWDYGTMPTCDTPTKEEDEEYTYTFAGWSPEVMSVIVDATYTATYKATKKPDYPTGIEDAQPQQGSEIRKVLRDNQLFILRGEKIYTVDGREMK